MRGTLIMKVKKRAQGVIQKTAVFALLLAAGSLMLQSQTYPFREYTSDDGLPQTQSTSVMQDSRGYIWIPTRNGLARFDGYSFISYLRKDGLPSNMIGRVVEDKNGTIWAVTMNGVSRFNGKNFVGYPMPDSLGIKQINMGCPGFDTATFFLHALIDYDNKIILKFENGIYHNFTADQPALQNGIYTPAAADPKDTTLYLLDDNWVAYSYRKGVLKLIRKGPIYDIEFVNGKPHFLSGYGQQDSIPEPFYWEGGSLAFFFRDREGTSWTGTETSIFRLISDAFVEYDKGTGLPEETWALAADPREGLWAGTVDGELRYFDGEKFTAIEEHNRLYKKHTAFFRGSTTLSNGEVWFSTIEGVLIWDGKRFRKLTLLPDLIQVCIVYEDPVDRSIFVGTDRGLFHIKGNEVINYEQMSWPGYGIVEGIARDNYGNYWLAGHYGVVYFDGKNFIPFRSAPAPAEMVWGVVCDHTGNIWSAGSDGLFICDPDEPVFNEALPDAVNLPANVIRDIGNNRLLVGRMMDLCLIDLDKYYAGQPDYYTIIDRSRGFRGNDCQDNGIIKDADGQWWILTADKLIRFDPDKITKNTHSPMTHITLVEVPGDTADWVTVLDTSLFYNKSHSLKITGRSNSVRITYTGISTRNPENLTFRYRMNGLEETWSKESKARSAVYTDIPPGSYTFEVHAINEDGLISEMQDSLALTVVPALLQSLFAIIMITLLALSLIVFLSFQIRKSVLERRVETARRQAESYRLQLNSVIKQFDPHFTFNAVTSVGSLIMKGEKEKAYNYFIKLSNLLRSIITDSGVMLRPLQHELDFVTRYCELQKLRFGNRFEYTITVSPDVSLTTPVPKMIIQSFAENSIKHGLENKKGLGIMEINIRNLEEGVEVTVCDNGIGRAAAAEMRTQGAGTGLKNIASIIEVINKANREKITFSLTDLYEGRKASGTEVRIFLPFKYSTNIPSELT